MFLLGVLQPLRRTFLITSTITTRRFIGVFWGAAVVNGVNIDYLGGFNDTAALNTFYQVNLNNGLVSQSVALPAQCASIEATILSGSIYIVDGESLGTQLWVFNGVSWTAKASYSVSRTNQQLVAAGGKVYNIGKSHTLLVLFYEVQ